jgi:DNA-binding response OmpR family regulator
MLPGLDGYSACQAIKSGPETRSTRVLMLTGVDSDANRKYAGEMGSDAYLTKPFTAGQLLQTIEQFEQET